MADRPLPASRERELFELFVAAVGRLFAPEQGLIARRVYWDGQALARSPEVSALNSIETVHALHLLRLHGHKPPLDPEALMRAVVAQGLTGLGYAELALAIRADSLGEGRHLPILWPALMTRFDRRASESLELAWTLSSLCDCLGRAGTPAQARRLLDDTGRRLLANQSPRTGLLYGSNNRERFLRRRSPHSSLSSQSYAIGALATYARVAGKPQALRAAVFCADALCKLQGPRGQWPRMYNVRDGQVIARHPTHSVNQDTAMPASLTALANATGDDRYLRVARLSAEWVWGSNELGVSLVDFALGVVWSAVDEHADGLAIDRQMFGYHPARWLAMTLAGGVPA